MSILGELMTSEKVEPEVKTTYEYVLDWKIDSRALVSWRRLNCRSRRKTEEIL